MSKKKVIIYSTQLLETGGIESHLKQFSEQMQGSDFDFSILVLNNKANNETIKLYKKYCKNVWLINGSNHIIRFLKMMCLLPIINLNRFEILYSNGQGNSILFLKNWIISIKNWVHHHHTSGNEFDQQTWTPKYKLALKKANIVIACANLNAQLMGKVLNRKIISIPCFSSNINREEKTINPTQINIGYFGRLIKEKGIETLCLLSKEKELSHVNFCIWGKSNEYFNQSYFNQYPNIKYKGSFNIKEELTLVLNQIDAFILYSTHPEGLPISLLEVTSAGLPWIATNSGGIAELCVNEKLNYLLPPSTTYAELKEHLIKFTHHLVNEKNTSIEQINLYKNKYASNAIKNDWKLALNGSKI